MFNEKTKVENVLKNGFDKKLPLKGFVFSIAKYYKHYGMSQQEAKETIDKLLAEQTDKLDYHKTVSIVDDLIKKAYESNYNFIDKVEVPIYLEEMREIDKARTPKTKKVLLALLYLSNIYGDKNGVFYVSFKTLTALSGMQNTCIKETINKFEELGYIEVVERNRLRKVMNYGSKGKSLGKTVVYKSPNKYRVLFSNKYKGIDDDRLLSLITDRENLDNDFRYLYNLCLSQFGFKPNKRMRTYLKI